MNVKNIPSFTKHYIKKKIVKMCLLLPFGKQSKIIDGVIKATDKYLSKKSYDYVVIVPWLIPGGADKFAINYVNFVKKLRPSKNILIITTEGSRASTNVYNLGLSKKVDFLPLAEIIKYNSISELYVSFSLKKLLSRVNPKAIHVILSKIGYEYIEKNGSRLRKSGVKIILTGFNNSITDESGKLIGYAVNEIPRCYKYADLITTDNKLTKKRWVKLFGFSGDNILVHNNPFKILPMTTFKNPGGLNILWAAHIRKEKNPEMVVSIANSLADQNIHFDCYGLLDKTQYPKNPFLNNNIKNLTYMGEFKNFFEDIPLSNYNLFLYTTLSDGLPNILIEAGIAGLPIITSKVGGIPELLGDYGILVNDPDSKDEFIRAINMFKRNEKKYKEKALRFYEHLSKNYSSDNFEKQISSMLKRIGL